MNSIFLELTGILIAAGVVAYILHFLKQPSIIAYIIVGLLIGPLAVYHALGIEFYNKELLHSLSEIGITLLLFMVGLDLDISQLKRIGKAAVLAGIGQVIFTSLVGLLIVRLLGFEWLPSLYIAIALTFSSTIIVVKLLTEKKDMQSLYGKLAVGIFLIQDMAAIAILIILAGMTGSNDNIFASNDIVTNIVFTLGKAFIIGMVVVGLSRSVFPRLMQSLLKSDELTLLFSLAWALGLAAFFTSPFVGFNAAIGGFVAGLALANTGAHYQISGRIKSLRDFFIIIFFIFLGTQLVLTQLSAAIVPALLLSTFVLIGNPIIVTIILGMLGYKLRTSFLTGITVAQISEFSLILMALGFAAGHVNETHVTIVTLVGIITIGISSYGILFSNKLYEKVISKIAYWFEGKSKKTEDRLGNIVYKQHVVIVGAHRLGSHIIAGLKKNKEQFIVIDFNPDVASHYDKLGVTAICGDIADPYMQEVTALSDARLIICTIPDFHDTLALLEATRKFKHRPKLIVTAADETEAVELYAKKADYVLLPHFVGGLHLAQIVELHTNGQHLKKLRERHLKTLQKALKAS
jgi:Kef-type K+ transport system membrane component KefB